MTVPRQFNVDTEFPGSPEEIRILRDWGQTLNDLATGHRPPTTERQKLFLEEVRGHVYAVSVSACVWIKYQSWLEEIGPIRLTAAEAARKESERLWKERQEWLEKDRLRYLEECKGKAEWEEWKREHDGPAFSD